MTDQSGGAGHRSHRPPEGAVAERDPRWPGAGIERVALLVRVDVDTAHRAVARIRHPHRALADRHSCRRGADRDRIDDGAILEVQTCHDAAVRLGDPEAPEPDRACTGALAERRRKLEVSVLSVDARDRVRPDVHGTTVGSQQGDRDRDERQDEGDPYADHPAPGGLGRCSPQRAGGLDRGEALRSFVGVDRTRSRGAVDLGDREHVPLTVDALQDVTAPFLEPEVGTTDQLARRPCGEDVSGSSQGHDPSPDDDGETSPACSRPARIPRSARRFGLDAEPSNRLGDRARADRIAAAGSLKLAKKPSPGHIEFAAPEDVSSSRRTIA